MTASSLFLEPLDVLFLRGNKLFGDPGSFGEALVPPWPSVAAGAIRSRMLADAGIDVMTFSRGDFCHPTLGTPQKPGSFTVTAFHLARRLQDGRVELLMAPPADLVITAGAKGTPEPYSLIPQALFQGKTGASSLEGTAPILSSASLPYLPVLAQPLRRKPLSGYWLTQTGWTAYLTGKALSSKHLLHSRCLWSIDLRIGVGISDTTGSAAEGRLFSAQAVAFRKRFHSGTASQEETFDTGFVITVQGATPPQKGLVRLGGDGRAAAIEPTTIPCPAPDPSVFVQNQRCRMVLTSPGIFAHGWLPTGAQPDTLRTDGAVRFELHGVSGWIVAAAVPRAETVSGWDLARRHPKPAQRAAAAGSVYWMELDSTTTAAALQELVERGLWKDPCEDDTRRAEGFNRFVFAVF
jgi:CRISPR-associated protein Cmr3